MEKLERGKYPRKTSIKTYRNQKIRMLTEDFYLKLTDLEKDHFYDLNTHADIDAYAHYLLASKL